MAGPGFAAHAGSLRTGKRPATPAATAPGRCPSAESSRRVTYTTAARPRSSHCGPSRQSLYNERAHSVSRRTLACCSRMRCLAYVVEDGGRDAGQVQANGQRRLPLHATTRQHGVNVAGPVSALQHASSRPPVGRLPGPPWPPRWWRPLEVTPCRTARSARPAQQPCGPQATAQRTRALHQHAASIGRRCLL